MLGTSQFRPDSQVDTVEGHRLVLDRVQRWATITDPRIVRRLWPAQPDRAKHALCPSCGGTMPDGMLVTLNQRAAHFPAGLVYQALAAGDVALDALELPIESGELWCVVCLPCLEAAARTWPGRGLSEHLLALANEALQTADAARPKQRRQSGAHPSGATRLQRLVRDRPAGPSAAVERMPNAIRAIAELATLRRQAPWTQAELAAAAGVSVGTVRRIERNAYATVSPRVRCALAVALGVAPAAIAEFRPSLGFPLPSPVPAAGVAPRPGTGPGRDRRARPGGGPRPGR